MREKLKICLIEFDLSSFGGRHIEFVDGFFDTFKQLGHDVKIAGCWTNKLLQSKEELIEKSMSNVLTVDDIIIKTQAELGWHTNPSKSFIEYLNSCDVVMSVAHHSRLWWNVTTPLIYWIIAQPTSQIKLNFGRLPNKHIQVWTESYHQRAETNIPSAKVVYAPLDYSMFRRSSQPWNKRDIDILLVTGITKWKIDKYILSRELKYIDEISKKTGLRVVGLFTCRKERKYEWDIVNRLSFETHVNISRREVPKFMGNSKLFFHPSPIECTPLVHFEALNSGCYPIVRLAGSVREQLGNVGIIWTDLPNMGFWKWIKTDILPMKYNVGWSIRQGKKFDRKATLNTLKKQLQEVVEMKI